MNEELVAPPSPLTVTIIPREDGGIRVQCDELPGLILSGRDVVGVMLSILPAAKALREYATTNSTADIRALAA